MNIENKQFIKSVLGRSRDRVYTAAQTILKRIGDEIELCKDALKSKKSNCQWPNAFIKKLPSNINEEVKIINDTCLQLRTEIKNIINSVKLNRVRAALKTKEEYFRSGRYIETYFDEDTKKLIHHTENTIVDETIRQMYHIWQYYLIQYKEFLIKNQVTDLKFIISYRYQSLINMEKTLVVFTKSFIHVTKTYRDSKDLLNSYYVRLIKGLLNGMTMPDGHIYSAETKNLTKIVYKNLEDIQPM